jgi:NADPH:quinone reductase-like Zn-dependent oxidoreductase
LARHERHTVSRPHDVWAGQPKRTVAGLDVAGVVEAVGKNVDEFQVGDDVFGEVGGSFAEYVAAPTRLLARTPENISFEEAGAVGVAALTALQGLRDHGQIQPGHKVLINGASGGVGTFAVQIAKALGAEVTAVCSTRNVEQARAIGADHVIDYTKQDFAKTERDYDLIHLAVRQPQDGLVYRQRKPAGSCRPE